MGCKVSRADFEWSYTEEPHASRRKLILAKYPQIKELYGHDSNMVYKVCFMITLQLTACYFVQMVVTYKQLTAYYFVQDASWPVLVLLAYCFGGIVNQCMMFALHEISHNLACGWSRPTYNRILGIVGNVIVAFPISVTFRKYHLEHHKYQGTEGIDMDLPSKMEGVLFYNTFTKCVWLFLQPFFYAFRPLFLRPKPVTWLEIINSAVQIAFDLAILYFFGVKSLLYLMIGTFLSMGIHPVAGHFIAEHYMFKKGYETYSYYGPLNKISFNAGYHTEHHDFPNIPGCRLPKVREIAPEFYNNLPCHTSWIRVLYDYVMDPDLGPYARVKRMRKPIPVNPASHKADDDTLKAE